VPTPAAAPVAVLFADVSGSTRLYELAGDAAAAVVVSRCIATLRRKTEAAGGRVMRIVGDEILAVFPSADAAARAAMEMQGGVALIAPAAGVKIGIRIGFNFGPVMERDGELYGDAVNVAARLASLAQKDQIITSAQTLEALSSALKAACRRLYTVQVKGRENPVELCQMIWRPSDDLTSLVGNDTARETRSASIRLTYRDKTIVLDAARHAVSFGRDASADVVIEDTKVSRAHCKIEMRMNQPVLADHSANGTYVTIAGDREVILRREEFTLRGHGWIAFGLPRAETTEWVEFSYEE
jgi:adenylate cyclase